MNNPDPAPPRRLKRRWFVFSLRGLMLFILIFGGWLGWKINQTRQQREAVAAVRDSGGSVHYSHEFVPSLSHPAAGNYQSIPDWGWVVAGRTPWGPGWLRQALGDEYFQEVALISLGASGSRKVNAPTFAQPSVDAILERAGNLSSVKTLQIKG